MMVPRYENPDGEVQSALNKGAMVSVLLNPGDTLTATMLDFWTLGLTIGIVLDASSVLGICAVGRASRMRWRCRVRMAVRSERIPSCKNGDLGYCFVGVVAREVNGMENKGPAAAA